MLELMWCFFWFCGAISRSFKICAVCCLPMWVFAKKRSFFGGLTNAHFLIDLEIDEIILRFLFSGWNRIGQNKRIFVKLFLFKTKIKSNKWFNFLLPVFFVWYSHQWSTRYWFSFVTYSRVLYKISRSVGRFDTHTHSLSLSLALFRSLS